MQSGLAYGDFVPEAQTRAFTLGAAAYAEGWFGLDVVSVGQCLAFRFHPMRQATVAVGVNAFAPRVRDLVVSYICGVLDGDRPTTMEAASRLALGLGRKLPLVYQTEAAECGLACLAMIAGYHGHQVDLPVLRRRFPISLKGITLTSLIDVANRMKLSVRPVRLELEQLSELRLPCILHWNMNHFVVLKSVGTSSIRIHDPASGERKVTLREISDAFTGAALEAWPDQNFEKIVECEPVKLRTLIGKVSGMFSALSQVLLLAFALELCALIAPLFMQWVLDNVIVSGNLDLLTVLAIGFCLLVVLQTTISAIRSWVLMHFGALLNLQWRANVFGHMLRLPLAYFEKRHLGDVVSRFRSIDAIQSTLTSSFIEAIAREHDHHRSSRDFSERAQTDHEARHS